MYLVKGDAIVDRLLVLHSEAVKEIAVFLRDRCIGADKRTEIVGLDFVTANGSGIVIEADTISDLPCISEDRSRYHFARCSSGD